MHRLDRLVNNRAERRILWTGAVLLLIAAVLSAAAAHLAARYLARDMLNTLLQYADAETLAAYGVSPRMRVQLLPAFPQQRALLFWCIFGITALLTVLGTEIAIAHTDRVYRDLEAISADCMRLAEDLSASPAQYGSESGSVRRVCTGIAQLADRTGNLAQQLTKRGQVQQDLLSDVSHQLKTSLAVIRLNRDMLSGLALPEETRTRLAAEIDLHLDGMELLVLETLKLAKLSADAVHYDFSAHDLAATLHLAAERLLPLSREKQIAVHVECGPEIAVPHDRIWLCEAVENLVKNALDHAGCTAVTVCAEQLPSAVRLQVRDNGQGIPPQEIPRLFERFHSAADGIPHSAGLGLPIARQILAAHGSSLTVFSDSTGTEFLTFLHMRPDRA